ELMRLNPNAQMTWAQLTFHTGPLQDDELRCFVLSNRDNSVVSRHAGADLGPSGTTAQTDRGTISEIYVASFDRDDSLCMARLIFHELMHNKLRMGNDMHYDYEAGFGLAAAITDCATGMGHRSTGMTSKNATAMARALLNSVPQFPEL